MAINGKWVYERITPITCENVIPENERDPYLINKLWKEKNAIIKEALSYLKMFIAEGFKYRIPTKAKRDLKVYQIMNSTLLSFIDECCVVMDKPLNGRIRDKKTVFKKAYYKWCDDNNYSKGKLKAKEMEDVLIKEFGEDFKKIDGYEKLTKIKIKPEALQELGIAPDYY